MKYVVETRIRAALGEPVQAWEPISDAGTLAKANRRAIELRNMVGGEWQGEPEYRVQPVAAVTAYQTGAA